MSDYPICNLIDSHAHLDMARFEPDQAEAIRRATQAGVSRIVNVGIDLSSSRKAIELARKHSAVMPAVGIHPQDTKDITKQDLIDLAKLAATPGVVAIGEIGLDFYRDYSPHPKQIEVLQHQLGLAARLKLPVIIHARQAEAAIQPLLKEWLAKYPASQPGVIHCFNGDLASARTYLGMGFYISLGVYIGYPSSKELGAVIQQLPLEKLLIETDSPFLPPQGLRGQRNEPAYVVEAAKELARIKGVSLMEVAKATTANAMKVFNLS
jgi:TatD DNase family protein